MSTVKNINLYNYLTSVFQSDVNQSLMTQGFNRFLSTDNTTHIAGYIGQTNAQQTISRQIVESTPERQAYQLAPTAITYFGAQTSTLSYDSFATQLDQMGVAISNQQYWGSTSQFNWIPPVNIDMLANYQNYYWYSPTETRAEPQYITIENVCDRLANKAQTYELIINDRGNQFAVNSINFIDNGFVITSKQDDLFTPGFLLYTTNTTDANVFNKFWSVTSSSYDQSTNQTTVLVSEPIALRSTTPPIANFLGQWWINATSNVVSSWNGTMWELYTANPVVSISLTELLSLYKQQQNCACLGDNGWDEGQWDDNQALTASVIWNVSLLASISFPNFSSWQAANGPPTQNSLWYNTSLDQLQQYTTEWNTVCSNFSTVKNATTGAVYWDTTTGCSYGTTNQWSSQNKWIHKAQVQSFAGVTRANLPILEFSSNLELNQWSQQSFSWLYRGSDSGSFEPASTGPNRLELEPINSYIAANVGGQWKLYLHDTSTDTTNRDVNVADIFVPGYRFGIDYDSSATRSLYTTLVSECRQLSSSDPATVVANIGTDIMCTIVTISDTIFTSPVRGGGPSHVRIVPVRTSMGDTFEGYHLHWCLSSTIPDTSPAASTQLNPLLGVSRTAKLTPTPLANQMVSVGTMLQEFTPTTDNQTTFLLDSSLQWSPTNANHFAIAGSGNARVYVDGIRQYGTYLELVASGTPPFTIVGATAYNNQTFDYVTGIEFSTPVSPFNTVRVEIGIAALADLGLGCVPVRTVIDDTEFSQAAYAGHQPVYMSIQQYALVEQVKTEVNQYPLFNTYNCVTGDIIDANSVLAFVQNSSEPINADTGLRIVGAASGDWTFTTSLVNDTNQLYAYRDLSLITPPPNIQPTTWWYDPYTDIIRGWDGSTWSNTPIVLLGNQFSIRPPIVSLTQPELYQQLVQPLWYNPSTNTIQTYNISSGSWYPLQGSNVIVGTDPSLRTIWRTNSNGAQYIPQYQDANRNPVPVGSPSGNWQVPNQWVYNPTHINNTTVSYSQVVSHFSSISASQPPVPGLITVGVGTLLQSDYNFGLGGTIHEYNDGYDLLISAVNVDNSPTQIIEYAQDAYSTGIQNVQNLFVRNFSNLFTNTNATALNDIAQYVIDQTISLYEADEYAAQLFSDTTAYNSATDQGVKNWVATAPIFGLYPRTSPYVVQGTTEIVHHDGHRASYSLTPTQIYQLIYLLISTVDSRTNKPLGSMAASTYPSTAASFISTYGALVPGSYWFDTSTNVLYRFSPVSVSHNSPSTVGLSDGAKYFNSYNNSPYQLVNGVWVPINDIFPGTPSLDGDLSKLWVVVDINSIFLSTTLEVEQRLYDVSFVTPTTNLVAIKNSQPTLFATYEQTMFGKYVDIHSLLSPLANTQYTNTDAFSWNYVASYVTTAPRVYTSTPSMASYWKQLYQNWFNTPYPHLEPWKLQGYTNKPSWWDATYLDPTSTRTWLYDSTTNTGMWANILSGIVPSGKTYPNGNISTGNVVNDGQVIPAYSYVPVNIYNVSLGGYVPDSVLPPYVASPGAQYPRFRSLFTNFSDIIAPQADYTFGSGGPTEWEWRTSIEYVYDLITINFLIDPVRFFHRAFGNPFVVIDGLQLDYASQTIINHTNIPFHGDLYDTNKQVRINGLNQWYVNYIRSTSQDANTSFNAKWKFWTPQLTYRFGALVDTESLQINNRMFDLSNTDYNVILSNDGTISQIETTGFLVSILATAPQVIYSSNQHKWKLQLASTGSKVTNISYYDVQQYPCVIDLSSNSVVTQSYQIVQSSVPDSRFFVMGDVTTTITPGTTFTVRGSYANNGSYVVSSTYYDPSIGQTRISVPSGIQLSLSDGYIVAPTRQMLLSTGDAVVFSGAGSLPLQLTPNTPYYVIVNGDDSYQVAETYNNAIAGAAIQFTTAGNGELLMGKLKATFGVLGGNSVNTDVWYHFEIDYNTIRDLLLPSPVYGLQTMINIIDGYAATQMASGLGFGVSSAASIDPVTGRTVNWQLEQERFLDWAYIIRQSNMTISDKYQVAADVTANGLSFTNMVPSWADNTRVYVVSSGALPTGITSATPYYIRFIPGTDTVQLYTAFDTTGILAPVAITNVGSGDMYLTTPLSATSSVTYPSFEINPQRDVVWINLPNGVLLNALTGSGAEFNSSYLVYDQYGQPLSADQFTVYRLDGSAKLVMQSSLVAANQQSPASPYDYVHFGGGKFFIAGYEHYLVFNNYTTGGDLIYDPFLGLQTQRFNLDFYRSSTTDLKPEMGGFYLSGNEMKRNILGTLTDLQNAYDVVNSRENTALSPYSRALLGYNGSQPYLDLLNVGDKAQFNFYRGMTKIKGSNNSVIAYTNSRRFIDAKLDEYWAIKLADFGSSNPQYYPEIKTLSTDALENDLRLLFLDAGETVDDSWVTPIIAEDLFSPVSFSDPTRWQNFPQQEDEIGSALFLDGKFTSKTTVATTPVAPTEDQYTTHRLDFWFDGTSTWAPSGTGSTFGWNIPVIGQTNVVDGSVYWKLPFSSDGVLVIQRSFINNDYNNFSPVLFQEGPDRGGYVQVNSDILKFNALDMASGVLVIFTVTPSVDKTNPVRLVDTVQSTVLSTFPLWDPARGIQYEPAMRNVNYQDDTDPAQYSIPTNPLNQGQYSWGDNEVGNIWLDTSVLHYMPYYDKAIYPNVTDRLSKWGQLAPWGSVNAYIWTKSTIPPTQWDTTVQANSQSANVELTGTAKSTMYYRTRTPLTGVSVDPSTFNISTTSPVAIGDYVIAVSSDTLPTPLLPSTQYMITSVTPVGAGYEITLTDSITEIPAVLTDAGVGSLSLVPSFSVDAWTKYNTIHESVLAGMTFSSFPSVNPTVTLTNSDWNPSIDTVDVYVNGVLSETALSISSSNVIQLTNTTVSDIDIITLVRTIHTLTADEQAFDPSTSDDGSILIQWATLYDYSTVTATYGSTDTASVTTTYYYFWVQDNLQAPATPSTQQVPQMSVYQVSTSLETIPIPYITLQVPRLSNSLIARFGYSNGPYGNTYDSSISSEQFYETPVFYRAAVIRGASDMLDQDNRYVLRFVRDLTLRNSLRSDLNNSLLAQRHEKWQLVRPDQLSSIPKMAWDKLTEALCGYNLQTGAPVPALNRVVYDELNSTSTQYGFGVNQAFVNKTTGLITILKYLEDTSNDFLPINITEFLSTVDFTTPAGIAAAMELIYTTFPANHVNAMWFESLMDALALQPQMEGIFKSSWVALHGVRILSVGGLFDD